MIQTRPKINKTRTGFYHVENDVENNIDNNQPSHRKHKEKEKPNSDQNTKEDQHNTKPKNLYQLTRMQNRRTKKHQK